MTEADHLSVTQMKTYLRCLLQYFFSYVCDVKPPANGAMALGRAVHSALEHNYRQKIQTGEDLPLSDLQDVFGSEWDRAAEDAFFEKSEKPGDLKDQGAGLLDVYHREIAPTVQPVDVERRFLIHVPGVKLPLLGYIDLIDDRGTIIDHKTSSRNYQQDAVDRDLQLTAYALAYRTLFGQQERAGQDQAAEGPEPDHRQDGA